MVINSSRLRLPLCGVAGLLPIIPIILRLGQLQTLEHEKFLRMADSESKGKITEPGLRGKIFDRNGNVLAESKEVWSCGVSKKQVGYAQAKKNGGLRNEAVRNFIFSLSKDIKVPCRELERKWAESGNYFYAAKELDVDAVAQLEKNTGKAFNGLTIKKEQARYHPSGNLTGNLLGAVDREGNGKSGLELMYDSYLKAPVHENKGIRDSRGVYVQLEDGGGEQASDLYLTLDRNLQFMCESLLEKNVRDNKAVSGTAIVQESGTGNLLALASYPSRMAVDCVKPNKGGSSPCFLDIPAVEWAFEPGSTIKIVTIAAALEEKTAAPGDKYFCENGKWQFSPKITIHDDEPEGVLTVSEIMKYSSNIGAAKIALKTGAPRFVEYLQNFGFGTKTLLGFPGESQGVVRPLSQWRPISLVTGAYGHGIDVTGIQLVGAYSAVANGGMLKEPVLLRKVVRRDGSVRMENLPRDLRRVVSENTAGEISEMLQNVVRSGTGVKAQINSYTVAGKTGTIKKLESDHSYSTRKYIATFCGFIPGRAPKYTILVLIDEPSGLIYGGQVAAPVFGEIAKWLITRDGLSPDALGEPQPRPDVHNKYSQAKAAKSLIKDSAD